MQERFQKLLRISVNLRETLSYELTQKTREELQKKLDLATEEIAQLIKNHPVIL